MGMFSSVWSGSQGEMPSVLGMRCAEQHAVAREQESVGREMGSEEACSGCPFWGCHSMGETTPASKVPPAWSQLLGHWVCLNGTFQGNFSPSAMIPFPDMTEVLVLAIHQHFSRRPTQTECTHGCHWGKTSVWPAGRYIWVRYFNIETQLGLSVPNLDIPLDPTEFTWINEKRVH